MKPPLLVTIAIPVDGDRVFLVKREREPFNGYWSLIGVCGSFERHSDPVQAVQEEVLFDVGRKFLSPSYFTYQYENHSEPAVCLVFTGRLEDGPFIMHRGYVSNGKWVSLKEALEMELAFSHHMILQQLHKSLKM